MLTEREVQSLRDLIARLELENRKLRDENAKLQQVVTPVPIPDRRRMYADGSLRRKGKVKA
jgi:hypothetical protein